MVTKYDITHVSLGARYSVFIEMNAKPSRIEFKTQRFDTSI